MDAGVRARVLTAALLTPVVATATWAVTFAPAASADTHGRIQAAERRLAALNTEAEVFAERMNAARDRYAAAQLKAQSAQHAADAAAARLASVQARVSAMAAQAYKSGGTFGATSVFSDNGDPAAMLDRMSMLDAISRSDAQTLADVTAARHDATAARMNAAAAAGVARRELGSVTAARARVLRDAAAVGTLLRQLHRQAAAQAAAAAAAALSQESTTPPPAATGPGGARAAQIAVQWAYRELGKPYVWGAAGPDSFDCSGLTQYIYGKAGIYLPHYTGDQWNAGRHVSRGELRPGDLVFYFSDLHHMGIYIGGGRVIHAPHTGDVVKISPLDMDPYAGAVRVAG